MALTFALGLAAMGCKCQSRNTSLPTANIANTCRIYSRRSGAGSIHCGKGGLEMGAAAQPMRYSVEAYNVSHASENKIHDDTVAKKLGFSGGLVPGVEVFAYAAHIPVARWGRAFLERGRISARFAKPVYDGRTATVTGTEVGDGLSLKVESDGIECATGTAHLPQERPEPPSPAAYPAPRPPATAQRPPADEASLAVGNRLAITPEVLGRERLEQYLADVRETELLYASEGLAHPGILLRLCNSLLRENVVLAPWIHTGSEVQFLGVARVGETLSARASVVANYERKGHRLVDMDCLLLADETRPVAHVLHTAIYRLRHLAA
jgi:acyl dehydratase